MAIIKKEFDIDFGIIEENKPIYILLHYNDFDLSESKIKEDTSIIMKVDYLDLIDTSRRRPYIFYNLLDMSTIVPVIDITIDHVNEVFYNKIGKRITDIDSYDISGNVTINVNDSSRLFLSEEDALAYLKSISIKS